MTLRKLGSTSPTKLIESETPKLRPEVIDYIYNLKKSWDLVFGSDDLMFVLYKENVFSIDNNGEMEKIYALQEPSPKEVDVRQRSEDGRAVGKRNSKRKEVAKEAEEVQMKGGGCMPKKKKGCK